MNELIINEKVQLPVLEINFDELEAQATQIAQTYASIAITDDTYMQAKADAKKLAGYANDIEKRRKAVKAQVEAPIKEFDKRCKAIAQILLDAKQSIENITVKYDEDRKNERRAKIQKYVDDKLAKSGLRPEFSSRIVAPANLDSLSATLKSIKEEYDSQIDTLKVLQDNTDMLDTTIETTVASANQKIAQQMNINEFAVDKTNLLDQVSTGAVDIKDAVTAIMQAIMQKADAIAAKEEEIRQQAIEAERERQRKAEEARQAEEARKAEEAKAQAEVVTEPEVTAPTVELATEPTFVTASAPSNSEVNPFAGNSAPVIPEPVVAAPSNAEVNPFTAASAPKQYEGVITLTGTCNDLTTVLNMLKYACKQNNVSVTVNSSREI